jgi:hypothetical protein
MLRECASDNALRGCQFAAHIVSCIPIVMHPVVCSYSTNIWMTIEQVITLYYLIFRKILIFEEIIGYKLALKIYFFNFEEKLNFKKLKLSIYYEYLLI